MFRSLQYREAGCNGGTGGSPEWLIEDARSEARDTKRH